MQCTHCLKLTVRLSPQFFTVPLSASAWSSSVLHIVTFVYIRIFSQKNFYLHTFDSDYPETSLNRHYLAKQNSPDKRGLTATPVLVWNFSLLFF